MPAPPHDLAAVVARLRAAGCVYAEDEADLLLAATADRALLARLLQRRCEGEPLEQVLGWAQFCGLRVTVEPGVFVPRARTGLLVRLAAAGAHPGAVVVDLCCGSGAVGAALAAAVPEMSLHAVDIDPLAVRCARRNLPGAAVYEGDLYAPLPAALRGRVDVLAANAPYVPTDQIALMPVEARGHEPRMALDGGADGLVLHRRIAAQAAQWLAPGGRLLIETSGRQADRTAAAIRRGGLNAGVETDEALAGTVVVGTRT